MLTVTRALPASNPQGSRRHALLTLAGLGAWALVPGTAHAKAGGQRVQLAAAWEHQGRFYIGLLTAKAGEGQPLAVRARIDVPTRAHGLAVLPDGTVLAASRRPGDWLLRWRPGHKEEPQWLWQDGERSFNGHVLPSPDGQRLYTTETDIETGASWVTVRDARTLKKTADWPTHGIDAHELIWDWRSPRGGHPTLVVANGGVPTAPETGRVKRHLERMDSSIVRLDAGTGALLGQWRLPDPRLSLRHLAWSPDERTLGIALQAEHDDAAAKDAAPVLALFDGQQLHTQATRGPAARRIHGYGGSIAATPAGWAVSCPRADGIATYAPEGAWQGLVPLPEVCPLAVHGGALWAGGLEASLQNTQVGPPVRHPHGPQLQGARLDNHWVLARG
ncbi:DUF1513 domain-containing protein [Paracidovorax sp. MALMAid1276]|uniref:DUF1513 domain-containing protein n=1 Tax=Paracidovorax sp. MALMAid1276 TaxID=3411631 RepID=UPI003B9AC72A